MSKKAPFLYYVDNKFNFLYHIKFFANNGGYQSCIVENLLQHANHTTTNALFRRAKKYFKFKILLANSKSRYYNLPPLPRHINASGAHNRSGGPLYIIARKYTDTIFSCGTNTKRMSFSDIQYKYDHGMAQVEDFNNVNFVKHQL